MILKIFGFLFILNIFIACEGGGDSSVSDGYVGDPTVPEISFNLNPINRVNVANYNLTGSCTDNSIITAEIDSTAIDIECVNGQINDVYDLSSLSDGDLVLSVSITHNVSNKSTSKNFTILKDVVGGVSSINAPSNGNYLIDDEMDFEIVFTSIATVDDSLGTPRIELDINGNTRYAQYISGSGSETLIFRYTVETGIDDTNGISISGTDIDENSGTIIIANASLATDISSIIPNTSGVLVYGILPTVSIQYSPDITNSNDENYLVTGSCSENGQNVVLNLEGINLSVPCVGGAWTSGNVDVSSEGDSAAFSISADHSSSVGYNATQAQVDVDKSTNIALVAITSAGDISSANVSSYSFSGTCSHNGNAVDLVIGTINLSVNCSSGYWSSGFLNVSSLVDNPAITISADHDDDLGNPASTATTTVAKDLSLPTVTISSAPNIDASNVTNYTLSGSCSENSRTVTLNLGGISQTPNCSGGTWYLSGLDMSSLSDADSISFTADHNNALGDNAIQASVSISKSTSTPSVNNLGVVSELVNSIDLTWTLEDPGGFTINDYIIQYRILGTPVWLTFNDGVSTNTNTQVTGLSADTNYEFRVALIYDTSNQSSYTLSVSGQTKIDDPIFGENKAMNVGGATQSRVVAFEDDTDITLTRNNVTSALITLQKGQTHTFSSQQFDVIDADKPIFTAGKRGPNNGGVNGANMVWQPSSWAGRSFSFNAIRYNPQILEVYPIEDGTITVREGNTILDSSSMTKGVGLQLSWSNYGSYQITSTGMVLLYHYSNQGGAYVDPKPIIPNAKKIIGFPSSSARLTAFFDSTNYSLLHSNSVTTSGSVNKDPYVTISSQGTSSLFQGESTLIDADKEVSAASFADSNGGAAAVYLPTNYMKNAYATNANADYVVFAAQKSGVIKVLDENNNMVQFSALSRTGSNTNAPTKARFANIPAGYRFFSTVPMAGWYQPNEYDGAMRSDETILYGTNLDDPTSTFTPPTNPITCKTIKDDTPASTDGVYSVDPDGDGGNAPYNAYCDMTTQGGGWTLVIRYDRDLASATDYSLPSNAGRSEINAANMLNLNATTNMAASFDIRPYVKAGATHFMHVTTASGDTNYVHTYFSDIDIAVRLIPDNLFDSSLDTNDNEAVSGSVVDWSSGLGNQWYESDFSVMTNTQTSGANLDTMKSISGGEGLAMFTNGSREGAVLCSGVSTSGSVDGHSNPKVNWGFRGKNGTQQNYGGNTHVGTYCRSSLAATECESAARMNFMFVR